jgi:hypothetical protein
LVTVKGEKKDINDFVAMLKEQKIKYCFPSETRESTRTKEPDENRYGVAREYYSITLLLSTLLCTVIVELTKESLKTIIKWLKERRKKGLKNPRLKVVVEGNVLNLNQKDIKILKNMLEEASKEQKPKKRRCSK